MSENEPARPGPDVRGVSFQSHADPASLDAHLRALDPAARASLAAEVERVGGRVVPRLDGPLLGAFAPGLTELGCVLLAAALPDPVSLDERTFTHLVATRAVPLPTTCSVRCTSTWTALPDLSRSGIRSLTLEDAPLLTDLRGLPPDLEALRLTNARALTDLGPLRTLGALRTLRIAGAASLVTLTALAGLPLRELMIHGAGRVGSALDASTLPELPLERLSLRARHGGASLPATLRRLWLSPADQPELAQLGRLTGLEELDLLSAGPARLPPRARSPVLPPLAALPLRTLTLCFYTAARLPPLPGSLEELGVHSNDLRDIGAVAEAPALRAFRLEGAPKVRDLSPLAGLDRLTRLSLAGSVVSKLDGLRGLEALEELEFAWTRALRDLSPLAGLPVRRLVLHAGVRELDGLAELPRLESLAISVPGQAPLEDLPMLPLRHLDVGCGALADLGFVRRLPRLRSLHLQAPDPAAVDASPLLEVEELEELLVWPVGFGALPLLARLPRLKTLKVMAGGSGAPPLGDWSGHPSLRSFDLHTSHAPVDFRHLPDQLEALRLHVRVPQSLQGIERLAGLKELELGGDVRDLREVEKLPRLERLRIDPGGQDVARRMPRLVR